MWASFGAIGGAADVAAATIPIKDRCRDAPSMTDTKRAWPLDGASNGYSTRSRTSHPAAIRCYSVPARRRGTIPTCRCSPNRHATSAAHALGHRLAWTTEPKIHEFLTVRRTKTTPDQVGLPIVGGSACSQPTLETFHDVESFQ